LYTRSSFNPKNRKVIWHLTPLKNTTRLETKPINCKKIQPPPATNQPKKQQHTPILYSRVSLKLWMQTKKFKCQKCRHLFILTLYLYSFCFIILNFSPLLLLLLKWIQIRNIVNLLFRRNKKSKSYFKALSNFCFVFEINKIYKDKY